MDDNRVLALARRADLPLPLEVALHRALTQRLGGGQLLGAVVLWERTVQILASAALATVWDRDLTSPGVRAASAGLHRPSLGDWGTALSASLAALRRGPGDSGLELLVDALGRRVSPRESPEMAALVEEMASLPEPVAPTGPRVSDLLAAISAFRNRTTGHPWETMDAERAGSAGHALLGAWAEFVDRVPILGAFRLAVVQEVESTQTGSNVRVAWFHGANPLHERTPRRWPQESAQPHPGQAHLVRGASAPIQTIPLWPLAVGVERDTGGFTLGWFRGGVRIERASCRYYSQDGRLVSRSLDDIGLARLLPGRAADLPPARVLAMAPYRGFASYDEAHSELFFGRDEDTARVAGRLLAEGTVLLTGPSGCGKSSLAMAGVVPALREQRGAAEFHPVVMRPGETPLESLHEALDRAHVARQQDTRPLSANDDASAAADRALVRMRTCSGRLLLVVDQAEELALTAGSRQCAAFLDLLTTVVLDSARQVGVGGPLLLVVARDDQLDVVLGTAPLRESLGARLHALGPVDQPAVSRIVTGPLAGRSVDAAPELLAAVWREYERAPRSLPLVSHMLARLWAERDRFGGCLSLAGYDALGGLAGVVASQADAIAADQTETDRALLQRCLSEMVSVADDGRFLRRRVTVQSLASRLDATRERVSAVLRPFIDGRLLTSDGDGERDVQKVEVAHEALFHAWPWLRDRLEREREVLHVGAELRRAVRAWLDAGREGRLWSEDAGYLLEAERFVAEGRLLPSQEEGAFLTQSRAREADRVRVLAEARARAESAREEAEELIDYLLFDLRAKLEPIGRLALLGDMRDRVSKYYEHHGDEAESGTYAQGRRALVAKFHAAEDALESGEPSAAADGYRETVRDARRLAARYPDETSAAHDVGIALCGLGDALLELGAVEEAAGVFGEDLELTRLLHAKHPEDETIERSLVVSLQRAADLAESRGEGEQALRLRREARERFARRHDASPTLLSGGDLAAAEEALGLTHQARGELDDAHRHLGNSVTLRESCYREAPEDAGVRWQLATGLGHVAGLHQTRGEQQLAIAVLNRALEIHEQLAAQDPDNARWQRSLASASSRMGELLSAQSDYDTALVHLHRDLDITLHLLNRAPDSHELRDDRATSLLRLGDAYRAAGRFDRAQAVHEEALSLARSLWQSERSVAPRQDGILRLQSSVTLSAALTALGETLEFRDDTDAAERLFEEDLALSRSLVAADPDNTSTKHNLSIALNNLASSREDRGDLDGSVAALEEDLAIGRELLSTEPDNPRWMRGVSVTLLDLARLSMYLGLTAEARRQADEGLALIETLAGREPANARWQWELTVALRQLGAVAESEGRFDDAIEIHGRVLEICERQRERAPHDDTWQFGEARAHESLAGTHEMRGELALAVEAYRSAIELARRLVRKKPDRLEWKDSLADELGHLGALLQGQGELDEAGVLLQERLRVVTELTSADPLHAGWRRDLCDTWVLLANLHAARGDVEEARLLLDRAVTTLQGLIDESDGLHRTGEREFQRELSLALSRRADVRFSCGDAAGAQSDYEEALEVVRALAESDPDSALHDRDIGVLQQRLADVHEARGDLDTAESLLREDLDRSRSRADAQPTVPMWQNDLSIAIESLAGLFERRGELAGASRGFEESLTIRRQLVQSEPDNQEWLHNLAIALGRLALVRQNAGDSRRALTLRRQAVEISRATTMQSPGDRAMQRDLAVALSGLGNALVHVGALDEADGALRESLAISDHLASEAPRDLTAQRDLSVVLSVLAELCRVRDELDDAESYLRRDLRVSRRLAEQRNTPDHRVDLATAQRELARVLAEKSAFDEALALAEAARDNAAELVAAEPGQVPCALCLFEAEHLLFELTESSSDAARRHFTAALLEAGRCFDHWPNDARARSAWDEVTATAVAVSSNTARASFRPDQGATLTPAALEAAILRLAEAFPHLAAKLRAAR